MMRSLTTPVVLLPLSLVTPYIFGGAYGVTVAELLIFFVFFAFTLPELLRGTFRLPRFLFAYLALFIIGWLGAVINGLKWHMPVGPGNLSFFYRIVLAIGAFYIGYRSRQTMQQVVTHPFFKFVIVGLGIVAALYPFMSYDQRFALLRFFYAGSDGEIARLQSARFPGLGINANVYSFMVFIFLLFTFDAYVRKLLPAIYPLLAFIIIGSAASKLVISVSAAACLLVLLARLAPISSVRRGGNPSLVVSTRALAVTVLLVLFVSGSAVFLTQTAVGSQIVQTLETFRRFADALEGVEGVSSFESRFSVWALGMERVELAPVLGIVPDRQLVDEESALFFQNPHNEFIELWMFYGIAGMLAHVFLICVLLGINLRHRAPLVWPLLYVALIAHMAFDAAFSYVRFCALFFMVVGMNLHYLRFREAERKLPVPAAAAA
jgi:O-antigen ligase